MSVWKNDINCRYILCFPWTIYHIRVNMNSLLDMTSSTHWAQANWSLSYKSTYQIGLCNGWSARDHSTMVRRWICQSWGQVTSTWQWPGDSQLQVSGNSSVPYMWQYVLYSWDTIHRAHSWFAPSQWETALLCNDISHWLGANQEIARISPDPILQD